MEKTYLLHPFRVEKISSLVDLQLKFKILNEDFELLKAVDRTKKITVDASTAKLHSKWVGKM